VQLTTGACPTCGGEVVEGLVLTNRGNSPPGNYRALFCRGCGHVLGPAQDVNDKKLVWEDGPVHPRRT